VNFEVVSGIEGTETMARGRGVRERIRLVRRYGKGRWRKRKGFADVRLSTGEILRAELHWYEANGIGRVEFKIKRFV
jgi:hypothetical protein